MKKTTKKKNSPLRQGSTNSFFEGAKMKENEFWIANPEIHLSEEASTRESTGVASFERLLRQASDRNILFKPLIG